MYALSLALLSAVLFGAATPASKLLLGALLGLGLLNKLSVLWLGAGIGVGLVATSERRWLATRWPWLAGALALAIASPYVAWLALHDWPVVEFLRNAACSSASAACDCLSSSTGVMHPLVNRSAAHRSGRESFTGRHSTPRSGR